MIINIFDIIYSLIFKLCPQKLNYKEKSPIFETRSTSFAHTIANSKHLFNSKIKKSINSPSKMTNSNINSSTSSLTNNPDPEA